jgi:ABC-type transport system substrate-binding protein
VLYQYIEATATEIEIKTGTFVEALTPGYEINYVPYTQTSPATRLYQSMFFDACIDYVLKDGQITYVEDLCSVTTNDNKNFTVILNQDAFRSNGSPVTLDDVYATYQYILIENMRNTSAFEAYNNVAIERRADDLVVTFPETSIDNRIFFTYFILPEHITAVSYDEYVALATTQDIGSACASMMPGTIDEASMVIDVSACEETRFDNYQLKYISDADADANFSYIDIIK